MITTGTPKQIAYAEDLKTKAVKMIESYIGDNNARIGKADKTSAQLAVVLPLVEAQTDAAWWIERNNLLASHLLKQLVTPEIQARLRAI